MAETYEWMVFVDGENFIRRGQELAGKYSIELNDGKYYCRDTFLWIPSADGHTRLNIGHLFYSEKPVRSFYYASLAGDDYKIEDIRQRLWNLKFQPEVFKKAKDKPSKGVDITLTKDMLVNAFDGNYNVAVLVSGDGDYVPVVEEVKRRGKVVDLWFFDNEGLSPKLKSACDSFFDLTQVFAANWTAWKKTE